MIDNIAAWGLFVGVGMTATGLGLSMRTEGPLGMKGDYSVVYTAIAISMSIFLSLVSGLAVLVSAYLVDVSQLAGFPTVFIGSIQIIFALIIELIIGLIILAIMGFIAAFFAGIHEWLGYLCGLAFIWVILSGLYNYLIGATNSLEPLIAVLVIIVPLVAAISIFAFFTFVDESILEDDDTDTGSMFPTFGFIFMFIFGWGFVLHGAATTPLTQFGAVFGNINALFGGLVIGLVLSVNATFIGSHFDKRRYRREREEAKEKIGRLTREIETKLDQAEQKHDSEQYSAAHTRIITAKTRYTDASNLANKYDLSFDPPVDQMEIDQRIKKARRLEAQADAESVSTRFDELMRKAEQKYKFGDMDDGDNLIEKARDQKEKLDNLTTEHRINLIDLRDSRFEIDRLRRSWIEDRYQSLLEDGDDSESAVKQATKNGQYITAVNHCEDGIEVSERAVSLAEEHTFLNVQRAKGGAEQFLRLKCDVLSDAVSTAQNNLQSNPSPATVERTTDALEEYIKILNNIDVSDKQIEDSFQIIEEFTKEQLVLGNLLDAKQTVEKAIESFEDGDYKHAKRKFNTAQSRLANVEQEADRYGVDVFDTDIEQLQNDCTVNKERTHKMELGLSSEVELIEPNIRTDNLDSRDNTDTEIFQHGGDGDTSGTNVFTGDTNQDSGRTKIFDSSDDSQKGNTSSDDQSCPQCGKHIPDDENAKFCSNCGTKL